MDESQTPRRILWVASAKKDLLEMPSDVIDDFGFGLYQAQIGEYPDIGKTLRGFGSANVIEIVQDYKGDTFRAVYTVRFSEVVVVLHAFQKKTKKVVQHQSKTWI